MSMKESVRTITIEQMQANLLKDLVLIFDGAKRQIEGIFNTEAMALDAAVKATTRSSDENKDFREILKNLKFNPDVEIKKIRAKRKSREKPNRAERRKLAKIEKKKEKKLNKAQKKK